MARVRGVGPRFGSQTSQITRQSRVVPIRRNRRGNLPAIHARHIRFGRAKRRVRLNVADVRENWLLARRVAQEIQSVAGNPVGLRNRFGKRQRIGGNAVTREVGRRPIEGLAQLFDARLQINFVRPISGKFGNGIGPNRRQNRVEVLRMRFDNPVEPLPAAPVFGDVGHVETVFTIIGMQAAKVRLKMDFAKGAGAPARALQRAHKSW